MSNGSSSMHKTVEQPLTEDERKRLVDSMPLAPSPFRTRQFKLRLISTSVGVLVGVAILIAVKKVSAVVAIPAGLIVFAIWWLFDLKSRVLNPLRRYREANEHVWNFRNAVNAAKTVRVHRVQSDTVVQVGHDEGTICLFDIGENRTYWIDPYFMVPGRPPEDWPNRDFEVVEVPGWEEEVGPFSRGKKLRPRATLEFRDLFEHYDFEPPPDGIIPQSLDDFLRDAQARNRRTSGASTA